jgi:hypothetical protein
MGACPTLYIDIRVAILLWSARDSAARSHKDTKDTVNSPTLHIDKRVAILSWSYKDNNWTGNSGVPCFPL